MSEQEGGREGARRRTREWRSGKRYCKLVTEGGKESERRKDRWEGVWVAATVADKKYEERDKSEMLSGLLLSCCCEVFKFLRWAQYRRKSNLSRQSDPLKVLLRCRTFPRLLYGVCAAPVSRRLSCRVMRGRGWGAALGRGRGGGSGGDGDGKRSQEEATLSSPSPCHSRPPSFPSHHPLTHSFSPSFFSSFTHSHPPSIFYPLLHSYSGLSPFSLDIFHSFTLLF